MINKIRNINTNNAIKNGEVWITIGKIYVFINLLFYEHYEKWNVHIKWIKYSNIEDANTLYLSLIINTYVVYSFNYWNL
jgi:hypothetical protein